MFRLEQTKEISCLAFTIQVKAPVETAKEDGGNWIGESFEACKMTVKEIDMAEHEIIKFVQMEAFGEDIILIKTKGVVSQSSSIHMFDPILVEDLLCVGGRLKKVPVEVSVAKNPLILPKHHHVVELIVRHYHGISGHSGQEYVLSLVRQKFWLLKGRMTVWKVLKAVLRVSDYGNQVVNKRWQIFQKTESHLESHLFPLFGVDCFGPFMVKRSSLIVKRYGVLFTCLSIRAVHIEVVHTLDTDAFFNALRRFIARRGKPVQMRSDDGGNFVKGDKELREAIGKWNLKNKFMPFCYKIQ